MSEEKKGFWSRLVSGLSKTRDNIVSGIAVGYGDPIIVYGASEGLSKLSEEGTDIEIGTAGNYTITLNLSQPPYYDYSIKKNG